MRARRVRRMMHRDDHGSCKSIALHSIERGLEIDELDIRQIRVRAALRRNHARIFQAIAVQRENPDEGSFERVIHARLDHGRPVEAARFRCLLRREGAKIREERLKGGRGASGRDHAAVISADGKDRPWIVAIRLVELVVIILRLTETVHHVA